MITKARGAKSRANLLRGGGKSKGRPRKDDPARVMARKLLSRPKYLKALKEKLDACTLHPSVHCVLLYYGYGKPKEVLETNAIVPIQIIHKFATDRPKDTPNE